MIDDKLVLLAKLETVYNQDAAPAATDAFLAEKPTFEILGKKGERKAVLPWYGTLPPINIGEGLKISFTLELRMSGALGTAPRVGRLLRACNMTETISAGVKVDYDPNSLQSTAESVTIYFYKDGQLYKLTGCRGSVKGNMKSNEIVMLSFEFTGMYAAGFATTQALITPNFGAETGPFIFRGASFTFMGYAASIFESFEFDLGNEIAKRPNANAAGGIEEYFIKDRNIKGSCDPEVVALATFDPWTKWDQSTPGDLSCQIGSAAASKLIVTCPSIVLDTPKHGERENTTTYALPWTSHPTVTAGNNEIKLSFQ